MRKEFLPPRQALEVKELGFDEECLGWYPDNAAALSLDGVYISKPSIGSYKLLVYAPLYQQVFRWFREKHNLYVVIIPTVTMYWTFKTMTVVEGIVEVPPYNHVDGNDYPTYKEAELESVKELINIVKQITTKKQ